ncbi:MAG TPA: hypothetical protein DCE41_08550 [Cytophagales bacterium]|nr:hypothetical protein [Cytophagales bacterium]
MTEKEFQRLMERVAEGTASQEEQRQVDADLASWQTSATWDSARHGSAKEAEVRIWAGITQETELSTPTRSKPRIWWVAASLVLLCTVGYLIFQYATAVPWETVATAAGERKTITLPDGTTVSLNAASEISYPAEFASDARLVKLSGEAFFEVTRKPAQPFTITTEAVTTTVLGTSFNVLAYPEETLRVTVTTGKVRVATAQEAVELAPNEQAIYSYIEDTLQKDTVNAESAQAWRTGKLMLNRLSFTEAIPVLERWFGITITLKEPKIGDCVLVANYQDATLEEVLESLKFILEIEYILDQDKQVTISGPGC